jgi:hypothetical protein
MGRFAHPLIPLLQEPSNVDAVTDLVEPSTDDLGFFRIPALHVQATWYPSLRKTVWLLNHLHQFVKVGTLFHLNYQGYC